MRAILLASVGLAALATAAFADNSNPANQANLQSNLMSMLKKSGYTDIKVAPSSFVVRRSCEGRERKSGHDVDQPG
jgi:hypothetical protein